MHNLNGNDSTLKTARQTPVAESKKTPNYSSQNDKMFFTSINNTHTAVKTTTTTTHLNSKNSTTKTIHAANSYVSPSNRVSPKITG